MESNSSSASAPSRPNQYSGRGDLHPLSPPEQISWSIQKRGVTDRKRQPMDEQARGIVLRLYPLTETSLIIQWLTPNFGRLATVAKGARRSKSPFRGKLDLFYLAEFTFNRSRRSELHT